MRVFPNTHKALTHEGANVFPMICNDGTFTARFASFLFKGQPKILDGGRMPTKELEVYSDEGGHLVMIEFYCSMTESDVAHKVSQAEKLLDAAK